MESKERAINLYLKCLLPLALFALARAAWHFPVSSVDAGMILFAAVTVFLSSKLRIQLPRNNIHLTIADAMVILSMLVYGGEVAIILTALESAYTSWSFRRKGVSIKNRTIVFNSCISVIVLFVAVLMVENFLGAAETSYKGLDNSEFAGLMALIALSLFAANTICVSIFVSLKSGKTIWRVCSEYCLDALVMYLSCATMAGVMLKALDQVNVVMLASVVAFFSLIYWTYRRNVDDVRKISAEAEETERLRAEQAEKHLAELEHYVGELEKSSEALSDSREKFRHAAYHDALTGLPNRNYVIETLRRLLEESRTDPSRRYAVLFLNLNRFRMINDSLGHATGDRIIRQVTKRISGMLADGDVAGHFGGDEFALILTHIENEEAATRFADKVANRLAESVRFKGREVYTSVSIGIAFGSSDYKYAEDILRDADIAMYNAKDNRRNSVIFDKTMHDRAVLRQQLETDLRYAIVCNELELFYQPIVRLADATLCGFEALVRWNHPKRGLVSPEEFIPVAESTGLIIPMTTQILKSACAQFVEWEKRYGRPGSMMLSVNVSVTHFADSGLVDQIGDIIAETGIKPSSLKLEITESAVMENAENAIAMLKRIKETGVAISIDDFGTGYSSLSYLHRFPIDYLKVDRSFVSAMEEGSENREIVRTIVALAKALKLSVIAEGIETTHQFEKIRNLGCEFGQGYLFSRPLPVQEIEELLANSNALTFGTIPPPEIVAGFTQIGLTH